MKSNVLTINKAGLKKFAYNYTVVILFLMLLIISSFLSHNFLTYRNVTNLLKQQSPVLIATFAMLFSLIVGNIDLSIGSNAACAGVVLGTFIIKRGWTSLGSLWGAIFICVFISLMLGLLNGYMVAFIKMPAFIVTLATSFSIRGLANFICSGQTIRSTTASASYDALTWFSSSEAVVLGIPIIFIVVMLIAVILAFVLKYTAFGRMLLAVGSNADAVELAGIRERWYRLSAYGIAGILAGVAGVLLASRAGVFSPEAASNYEMTAISGAVIGGASMHGGKGAIFPTVLGVFVIAMIENIMNLMSIPPYPQQIINGAIIILAVISQIALAKSEKN